MVFFRRVVNLGDGPGYRPGGGGGDLGTRATAQELAALPRVDPVGVPFPVAFGPDRPTGQPLPVGVSAWSGLWLDSAEPFAIGFTRDSQGPRQAAPSPSSDVTLPAGLFSEEIEVSGAKGTSWSPDVL